MFCTECTRSVPASPTFPNCVVSHLTDRGGFLGICSKSFYPFSTDTALVLSRHARIWNDAALWDEIDNAWEPASCHCAECAFQGEG